MEQLITKIGRALGKGSRHPGSLGSFEAVSGVERRSRPPTSGNGVVDQRASSERNGAAAEKVTRERPGASAVLGGFGGGACGGTEGPKSARRGPWGAWVPLRKFARGALGAGRHRQICAGGRFGFLRLKPLPRSRQCRGSMILVGIGSGCGGCLGVRARGNAVGP